MRPGDRRPGSGPVEVGMVERRGAGSSWEHGSAKECGVETGLGTGWGFIRCLGDGQEKQEGDADCGQREPRGLT